MCDAGRTLPPERKESTGSSSSGSGARSALGEGVPEGTLASMSCSEFVASLAAREPVPGGGAAAALAGALASSLCSMVGAYTVGKRRFAGVEDDVRRMMDEAEGVRLRLLELMDEDARAFAPLAQAYSIPRNDPGRTRTLEAATKGACAAPLEMMRQVARTIALLEEMGEKGPAMLLSDVGCGALLARAALESASLNVLVNTASLSDRMWAERAEATCDALLGEYVPRARSCARRALSRIRAPRL